MAEGAVLSTFMQVLFDRLSIAASDEFRLLRGIEKELQNMSTTLSTIQALVEDAEEKQLKDKVVRTWLANIKDVAYEMDEILDSYAAEALRSKLEGQSIGRWKKVKSYLHCICFQNGLFNYRLAQEIKAINEKLDKLVKDRYNLGLQMFGGMNRLEITERPKTSSVVDDSSIIGREEDREKIINLLLSPNNSLRACFSILPIVGMGGLGKTTLAQLVYNDDRIKEHFTLRMWVCVSEDFDETKLTKETLESSESGFTSATTNMNLLQENLCKKLKGKRFLLVLDDVWNEDPTKWYSYYKALIVGERGSKIIVTTQNENVGRIMGGLSPYHLEQLSDKDCWNLFRNYAFVNGDSSVYPHLEEIGKEIVKKLKGLPLAVKAIGSLLYSKVDVEDWMNILKSEIWELPSDKNNILPALRLSYKHLPPHLKQCFAFCSVFHKDYVFEKDKLVQIWMGLGFVQPQGRRRAEDVGSSYFDDMLSRSFFQSHRGKYVMHDAIHDLAVSVSQDECLRLENHARSSTPKRIKHLSFSCDNSKSTSFQAFYHFERTRTLLLLRGYRSKTGPLTNDLFFKLRFLRVLELNRRDITELPDSIGNLKQLRYLNISGTGVRKLPSPISSLYNLQTLKLRNCVLLDEIPRGVTKLVNLRHLEASTRLITDIDRLGNLTCLQNLEEFVVRKDKGYKITELKEMMEIRGRLSIRKIEDVNSKEEASEALLSGKHHLSVLELVWSDAKHVSLEEEHLAEQVLEALQPNTQLKELAIKGFVGTMFPNWLSSLSFVQTIHLSDCGRCKLLPSLGQLPFLKYLDVGGMHAVVRIGQEFSGNGHVKGFPSLIELVVDDMSDLKEWVSAEDGELFPRLTDLEVLHCTKLRVLPVLPPTLSRLRIAETGINILPEVQVSNSVPSSSLSSLQIHECTNLISLQQGLLTNQLGALKELTITSCEDLLYLPVQGFKALVSLKSLHIYNCPRLAPSGQDRNLLPPLLEDLCISSCSKLINPLLSELKDLPSLSHLRITDCDDLYCFPDEELSIALRFLEIFRCRNLRYLPAGLRELPSLTTLIIANCPLIPHLPEKGLPRMLQELNIKDCPLLTESCQENNGEDWPNIAHVPNIQIDEEGITSERRVRRRRDSIT
ncbi:putative disease resistance protein RGA3 [Typha latifolia]|uniref:putative disease resistance protein RGA3 n=1 Tax=Typha latifolia TaxID=4733 RepID=UPI003C2CFF44